MDRRSLLKAAAAGTAATAFRGVAFAAEDTEPTVVRSTGQSDRYLPALRKLIAFAQAEVSSVGLPGMTICVVDADGFVAVKNLGLADIDRRIPVGPSHLFQIGSISKSFAALCVYRLADEGKVDLDAPISRYLPDVPLPAEAMRIQQLLSHTAGLPASAPPFPRVPDKRLWTGFTPGTSFFYSNTAFELIGLLIVKVTGKPFPIALRDLVIRPLGITSGLKEVIQARDREQYAIGYCPLDNTAINMSHVPLGPAQWINFDTADGNIGATADAMSHYLHYLIRVGRGRGAPLFSDAAAKRFSQVIEPAAMKSSIFGPGSGYASGLGILDLDGHQAFHHTGGILGFASCITVDPVSGVGCFVSVNGKVWSYRPANISKFACQLMRQARDGGKEPARPKSAPSGAIENPGDFVGTYVGPNGQRFEIAGRTGRLVLAEGGVEGSLESGGSNRLISDHPRFRSHFLDFEQDGDRPGGVWFGPVLFGRNSAVPQPVVPPELGALQGVYSSSDYLSRFWLSVFAQGERLVLETPLVRTKSFLRREADYWRIEGPDGPCERLRFEAMFNGTPQRLNYSGRDLWRFHEI